MWTGRRVYFLSDRGGPASLFAYDTDTKKVSEVVHNDGLDFKSASATNVGWSPPQLSRTAR